MVYIFCKLVSVSSFKFSRDFSTHLYIHIVLFYEVIIVSFLSTEMPGLMLLRRKTCASVGGKPLSGARIAGCTHITAQSAVSYSTVEKLVKEEL